MSMFSTNQLKSKTPQHYHRLISEIVLNNYSEFLEAYETDLYELSDKEIVDNDVTTKNIEYLRSIEDKELFEMIYRKYNAQFHTEDGHYKNLESTYEKHLQILLEESNKDFNSFMVTNFENKLDQIEFMSKFSQLMELIKKNLVLLNMW